MADRLVDSTCGLRLCQGFLRLSKRQRREVPPCRVTNTEEEMKDPADPSNEYMEMGPQYQEFKPELGPMSRRVETTFLEGIYSDKVNMEETDYWFTEPEGGWNSEGVKALRTVQVDTEEVSATHFAPGRTELHELKEGEVMAGIVTGVMYNHGVQVDLGAQYDGLIPVRGSQWVDDHFRSKYGVSLGVSEDFYVGQGVRVKIHKINSRPKCRFPIQLEVLFPDVQHKLDHPDDFIFPFDLRGVQSREEAAEITGRSYLTEVVDQPYIDHEEIRELELPRADYPPKRQSPVVMIRDNPGRADVIQTVFADFLAQRVPELSASAYGERDVNFEDIDIWDKDVMDLIDSQDLDRLEDAFGAGQRGDQVEIVQEDDMYVE